MITLLEKFVKLLDKLVRLLMYIVTIGLVGMFVYYSVPELQDFIQTSGTLGIYPIIQFFMS